MGGKKSLGRCFNTNCIMVSNLPYGVFNLFILLIMNAAKNIELCTPILLD